MMRDPICDVTADRADEGGLFLVPPVASPTSRVRPLS